MNNQEVVSEIKKSAKAVGLSFSTLKGGGYGFLKGGRLIAETPDLGAAYNNVCSGFIGTFDSEKFNPSADNPMHKPFTIQPATANDRKRQERERKRASGLVKLELWLKPDDAKKVKQYAEELKQCEKEE